MMIKCSLGILFMALFAGCASDMISVKETVRTEPTGGMVACNGQIVGRAPVIAVYPMSQQDKMNGWKELPPLTVKWISGASTTTGTRNVKLVWGYYWTFTDLLVVRPSDAPNAQMDATYGAQLEQGAALNAQAVAQQRAATAAEQPKKLIIQPPLDFPRNFGR